MAHGDSHDSGGGGILSALIAGAVVLVVKFIEKRNADRQAQLAARSDTAKQAQAADEAFDARVMADNTALREQLRHMEELREADMAANRQLWQENQEWRGRCAETTAQLERAQGQLERTVGLLEAAHAQLSELRGQVSQQAAELAVRRREGERG